MRRGGNLITQSNPVYTVLWPSGFQERGARASINELRMDLEESGPRIIQTEWNEGLLGVVGS